MIWTEHAKTARVRTALLAACLISMILLAVGCATYSTSSGRIDESLRRVHVAYLENRTAEPDIDIELTDLIISALQEDNTLKVVGLDAADTELTGAVLMYQLKEAFTTQELQVDEYQVQILVELTMTDRSTGDAIFKAKRIRGTGNFIVDDPEGSTEYTAREEAAAEIIHDVLAVVVEHW